MKNDILTEIRSRLEFRYPSSFANSSSPSIGGSFLFSTPMNIENIQDDLALGRTTELDRFVESSAAEIEGLPSPITHLVTETWVDSRDLCSKLSVRAIL